MIALLLVILLASCAAPTCEPIIETVVVHTERTIEVELPAWSIPWPVHGPISSGFGPRTGYGGQDGYHRGLDVAVPTGTPVVSPIAGTVAEHWPAPGGKWAGHPVYGGAVYVSDGELLVLFAHLSETTVHEGETVEVGQVIGLAGSTGWSTGPHLHIEIWINPEKILWRLTD